MMRIQRAMLIRRFRFVARRAAASVDRGVSIDQSKERPAAVGNVGVQNAERAAFADFGAGGPVVCEADHTHIPQPRRRGFGGSLTESGESGLAAAPGAHHVIYRTLAGAFAKTFRFIHLSSESSVP